MDTHFCGEKDFYVVGVDRSEDMLASAMAKNKKLKASAEFIQGDICNFYLNKKFDVAIDVFAVMGYQITNEFFRAHYTILEDTSFKTDFLCLMCGLALLLSPKSQKTKF